MARLSTGQAYGDTSRATAAQLLGGIPVDGFAGELAQGSIATPSLQPRATPVDTFQRVGAPTLGGAPKFFAPPDLPNPGQDLANLSRALGGFSTTLQNFGETWLANRKEEDKKVEAAAGALVGQASRFGPARDMAGLAANLEKAAALGNPDAARMLQIVREQQNNSVGKYWLGWSIEQNAIQNAALSLPDLVANTSVIKGADGKDYDSNTLSSDDPTYLAHESALLFGGAQMSAQGYARNQGIIIQAQLQARQVQRKKYNQGQAARLAGQIAVDTRQAAERYVLQRATGKVEDAEDAATMSLQRIQDDLRILPISEEEKAQKSKGILEDFVANVASAAKQSSFSFLNNDMGSFLMPVLERVMGGPVDQRVKADGTANEALRLFNALGGYPYLDGVVAKANQSLIQDNTQRAQMAGIQQQQEHDAWLATALPAGRRSDPAAIKSAFQARREQISAEPDGVKRAAGFSQLDASERQLTDTYVTEVQNSQAYALTLELDKTRDSAAARNALAAKVQTLVQSNQISTATAISIQTTLTAQGNEKVQSYRKEINKRVDDITKDFKAYVTSPNSYGREAITGFEYQSIYNAERMAFRRLEEAVDVAIKDGKDPTEAMNKVQLNNNFGLRRREEVPGVQPPRYTDTTELIKKNTGNWSRSTIAPREANELRSQAKVRPLMELEPWDRDVTSLLNGNPSQNFKTLLKTLTTGPGGQKPSEVILNQFRLLGIEVPENELQKIRALDGQEISRAPAPRRTTPQQNQALAGVQIVGGALGNLLVPPAQARPNGDLGNQLAAQLEARGGYEDTAGPAVQRRPWAGEAGQFAPKGSFRNGLDAINKAGASITGFLAGKPNDIKLVTQFYSKNPEVANQYDLPVNLFVRYISGLGVKGLQVSQEQGRSVLESIRTRRADLPEHISWFEKNHPAWAAMYKKNIAKGMIPVDSFARGNLEIGNSLGRFWATPQKDGSYLITEDFNFYYAPTAQGGDDKRAKLSNTKLQAWSINPMLQANRLVTRGFGKPFRYTLRVSPDGRVQVNP